MNSGSLAGLRPFFDHSRHTLEVFDLTSPVDVLTFEGHEHLSQPFSYRIEFTSTDLDIAAEQMLAQHARFSLQGPPPKPVYPGLPVPEVKPLRTLHGVITGFKRLSGSRDEARYQATLEPRLALLGRGRQYRLYQHLSVPQIVESILRSRHGFMGQDFYFNLARTYPRREQVMQYGESDLAFYPQALTRQAMRLRVPLSPGATTKGWAGMPYKLFADGALLQQGVLDDTGELQVDHQVVTQQYRLEMANGTGYQIPIPTEYRNAEQAQLADSGLQNPASLTDTEVNAALTHTEHRSRYAAALKKLTTKKGLPE